MYVCSLGHSDHTESHYIRTSYQSETHTKGRVYTRPPSALDRLRVRVRFWLVLVRLKIDLDDDDDFKLSSSRRRRLDVSVRRAETTSRDESTRDDTTRDDTTRHQTRDARRTRGTPPTDRPNRGTRRGEARADEREEEFAVEQRETHPEGVGGDFAGTADELQRGTEGG